MKEILLFCALTAFAGGMTFAQGEIRLETWEFRRGTNAWRTVSVPHDWAIEGSFADPKTAEAYSFGEAGALPWTGSGEYRTTVEVPREAEWASVFFDGAMSHARVLVDGEEIVYRPNGYVAFEADFSRLLVRGTRHEIVVRLDNPPDSSRWYPGAGLYRPVRLVWAGREHLHPWEVFARTVSVRDGIARIAASAGHRNVRHALLDAEGREVAAGTDALEVRAPKLWSPETPYLYTLVTKLLDGDRVLDERRQRFGIRTVEWRNGLFELNGKVRKFKGVCLHHDLGPIGAAFDRSAFRRQVRLLKEMGCDAIRTSHNMPAPEQVDICDELGLMVMGESFDEWADEKKPNGYHLHYGEWWRRDLEDYIRAFRNHPSIVMWSIGNEVPDQKVLRGVEESREMQDLCHRLDPSRPVTQGHSFCPECLDTGGIAVMDMPGLTYRLEYYDRVHEASAYGGALGVESASTVSTRGEYFFPASNRIVTAECGRGYASSYDLERGGWANLPDENFAMQEDHAWTQGEFVWTGFDYLGEPYPFVVSNATRSSNYGIFDLGGIPKDRYWLYRSVWRPDVPTLHILPHWNWGPDRQSVPVYVYSNFPEVELFINGRSLGRRRRMKDSLLDRYRFRWQDVRYEPGELKAVAYDGEGREALSEVVKTAGTPQRIVLKPDAKTFGGAEAKLLFVTAEIVDRDGVVCPNAANRLSVDVTGSARFRAACNGDPADFEPMTSPSLRAFHGKQVIVLEATGKGLARLEVRGAGLTSETACFDVK